MFTVGNTALLVIDVQVKLAHLMYGKEEFVENLRKVIKGAQVLGIPIIWTEQNPRGLGPTIPEIKELLPDNRPITKFSFSCCGEGDFMEELRRQNRKQILITGIEAHICVYQTAMDLLGLGYEVEVVADAVSSRVAGNKRIGLEKVRDGGGRLTSTETAIFELLRVAEGERFKEILQIMK